MRMKTIITAKKDGETLIYIIVYKNVFLHFCIHIFFLNSDMKSVNVIFAIYTIYVIVHVY